MSQRTGSRWVWLAVGVLAFACDLNPQPDLPGSNATSGSPAGTGNMGTAGSSANLGGSVAIPTGGTFSMGAGGAAVEDPTADQGGASDSAAGAGGAEEGGDNAGGAAGAAGKTLVIK